MTLWVIHDPMPLAHASLQPFRPVSTAEWILRARQQKQQVKMARLAKSLSGMSQLRFIWAMLVLQPHRMIAAGIVSSSGFARCAMAAMVIPVQGAQMFSNACVDQCVLGFLQGSLVCFGSD